MKQNAHTKIVVPDTRVIFIKRKIGRFIKLFDKVLPRKHIDAIYNRQNNKKTIVNLLSALHMDI